MDLKNPQNLAERKGTSLHPYSERSCKSILSGFGCLPISSSQFRSQGHYSEVFSFLLVAPSKYGYGYGLLEYVNQYGIVSRL